LNSLPFDMLTYYQLCIPNVKLSLLDMRRCFLEYGEMLTLATM